MIGGIIYKATRMRSQLHDGYVYKCSVLCEDKRVRTLWADRKMANFPTNWEEIVETLDTQVMKGRGFVLGNLKILTKKGKPIDDKLDADVRPDLLEIVALDDQLENIIEEAKPFAKKR